MSFGFALSARYIAFHCICDRFLIVWWFLSSLLIRKKKTRTESFHCGSAYSRLILVVRFSSSFSLNLSGRELRAILTSFSCLFCICDYFLFHSHTPSLSFLPCGSSHNRSGKTLYFRDRLEQLTLRREERLNCFVRTSGKHLVCTGCIFDVLIVLVY